MYCRQINSLLVRYRDEYMPQGVVAPYQVKLDDGGLIYCPADQDTCVRRAVAVTGRKAL